MNMQLSTSISYTLFSINAQRNGICKSCIHVFHRPIFFFCNEQVGHNPCMVVCVPFGGKCLFYLPNGTHFSFISDDVRVSEDSEAHLVNQRFFFIMIHPFEKKLFCVYFSVRMVFFNRNDRHTVSCL